MTEPAARPRTGGPLEPPTEREIDAPGGVRLLLRHWRTVASPAPGAARGLLAIVPGFSDHGLRFPKLVAHMLEEGYDVAALDTRGHGRSSGVRGFVEAFDDYLLDVDRFLAECRATFAPGKPLHIWGHSMGGLITLAYLSSGLGRGAGISAAVVCAPPFAIVTPVPRWKTALARGLSRLAPRVAIASEVRPEDLSRDLSVGEAYLRDPLAHRVMSPRLYTEMTMTAARLLANPVDYGVPTMFIHGTDDRLCGIQGTRGYFERSPLARKEMRTYDQARHEIHNDPACVDAVRDALAFFGAHARRG